MTVMSPSESEPESPEPVQASGKMTERFRIEGDPVDALKALLSEPLND